MKTTHKLRILTTLLLLIQWGIGAVAQYNPSNPPEPSVPVKKYWVSVSANPSGAGSVSGSGSYEAGQTISVSASAYTNYSFVNWTRDGEVLSTSTRFSYTVRQGSNALVANYRYTPGSPDEPSTPATPEKRYSLYVRANPSGAGSVSPSSTYTCLPGTKVSVSASAYSGYSFANWTDSDGNILSTSSNFTYTTGEKSCTLTANFRYTPGNPSEPSAPDFTSPRLYLRVNPSGAGSVSPSSGNRYAPGSTVSVSASSYTGYSFVNWTNKEGKVIGTSAQKSITMGVNDTTLTANFRYNPSSPNEPGYTGATRNAIYGGRTSVAPGGSFFYDVNLENKDAVYGINIDVSMPEGLTPDYNSASLTTRTAGYTYSCSQVDAATWRLTLRGTEPIAGGSGAVIRIPVKADPSLDYGLILNVAHSHGVIVSTDGTQTTATAIGGIVKTDDALIVADSPDFVITSIDVEPANVMPGDRFPVSWTVANKGTLPATGGWNETIYLMTPSGKRLSLLSTYHDTSLMEVNAAIERNADVTVPEFPGLDGPLDVMIELMPYVTSGEIDDLQTNNSTTTSGTPIALGKRLVLTVPESIPENSPSGVTAVLKRSGDRSAAETFSIRQTAGDDRLILPENVTIRKDQTEARFMVAANNNQKHDTDNSFAFEAEGLGYDPVEGHIMMIDDDFADFELYSSNDELTEGESFELKIEVEKPVTEPVVFSITSDHPALFRHPSSVTLEPGKESATVIVEVVDDDEVRLTESVEFTVSAPYYDRKSVIVEVFDNDMPQMQLTLTPAEVKEDSGISSVVATLRRLSNTDKKVTVRLSDNAPEGEIYWPRKSIVMDKGVECVELSFGVNDNNTVDGDREVIITAAVYVQSCSCSPAENQGGSVSAVLTVIDDDGPTLTLSASGTSLLEGDSKGLDLTISRNTDTTGAVSVSLSADNPAGLEFPSSILIPAGQKSVTVNVKAPANDISDDSRTIVFSAEGEGFSKGICWVILTDRTLPDAVAGQIKASAEKIEVGEPVDITFTISNEGSAPLADALKITLYASGITEPLATFYTSAMIAPGESLSHTREILLPAKTGNYSVYAIVNKDKTEKELLYTNNTSGRIQISVLPPFRATLDSDKPAYLSGESINLSGRVEGKIKEGDAVEVYVLHGGLHQSIPAVVDASGSFSVRFTPYAGQMGRFTAGACYPGENLKEVMAEFDILGMQSSGGALTLETTTGTAASKSIRITNPASIPLKQVKASVLSAPKDLNVDIKCPSSIGAGETIEINCKVKSDRPTAGNDWEKIILVIESEEGASLQSTLYFYCRNPKGQIASSISEIRTTTMVDQPRQYSFKISNVGHGNSGAVTLALPDWIKPVTPRQMPSLAPNDTTEVILRLEPTSSMQLNVPVTGRIAINCANGDGLAIPFSIEPVSQAEGTLVIDVCDEYTYYTEEKPHVAGAQVTVMHPVSSAVLAQGVTGEDGLYSIELPEGYYKVKVTCQRHESYQNILLVDPGVETRHTIDLGVSNVEVSFRVEETEIEDEYQVVTTYTFSTQVPTPVVTIKQDREVNGQDMAVGESKIINFTLTNEGLIKAQDVALKNVVAGEGWKMEFLGYDGPFDLGAHQSRTIPMLVTKTGAGASSRVRHNAPGSGISPCMGGFEEEYKWVCGKALKESSYTYGVALQICAHSAALNDIMGVIAQLGAGGGSTTAPVPGPPVGTPDKNYLPDEKRENVDPVETEPLVCDDDAVKCADKIGKGLAGLTPGVGNMVGVAASYGEAAAENRINRENGGKTQRRAGGAMDWKAFASTVGGMITDGIRDGILGKFLPDNLAGPLAAGAQMAWECKEFAAKKAKADRNKTNQHSLLPRREEEVIETPIDLYLRQLELTFRILEDFFGDRIWFGEEVEETLSFFKASENFDDDDDLLSNLRSVKPDFISDQKLIDFVDRVKDLNPDNRINLERFNDDCAAVLAIEQHAKENGYESGADMYRTFIREILDDLSDPEGSVCSKVKLRLTQSMVMTRQAFRGYLNISNGDAELPLTGLTLILDIRDSNGNVATNHEFETVLENLNGFTGASTLDGPWALAPKQNGEAQILFIPTRYAAETTPMDYTFSGLLRYKDPYTGLEVTRSLSSTTLTVSPSPVLDLEYFLPRTVYGDDPFTIDIVEESIPSEFAMTIRNTGHGDAKNLRLTTNAPDIIENEKGLLVDFQLIGASVNGEDKNLALGAQVQSDFGTIPALSSAYAQWWIECSLAGQYGDYDVSANHVTSYGNPDLSLVEDISVHELAHGFTISSPDGNQTRAFLVNDEEDSDYLPDNIRFGNGEEPATVDVTGSLSVSADGENRYRLTLSTGEPGWNYAVASDPTAGRSVLLSVIRMSDGTEIPVDNVWQTPYIVRDHERPVHEKQLHIIARQDKAEDYLLTFEPRPDKELEVLEFTGVAPEALVSEPVESVGVVFNKDIDRDSFTSSALTLYCEGRKIDLSDIDISRIDERTFEINLKEATAAPGYYVLTVQTSQLRSADGFSGHGGYSIRWNQNIASGVTDVESMPISLYPAPMETEVYVSGCAGTIECMEFFDSKGRLCKTVRNVGSNEAINVGDLAPDVYLVSIRTPELQKIVKTIKH